MPLYNIEAINLRSRNTGEADKIITLFSKGHGKISAIAKGARRPTSKFGGRLEIFSYNQLCLATAKSLDIISQCESIESFYKLREKKDTLNSGFYLVKLVDIITEDRQQNDALFELLLEALNALNEGMDPKILSRAFEARVCDVEGLLPSDAMLERTYSRLPFVVKALRGKFNKAINGITDKDFDVSGKVFRMILSDHAGKDVKDLTIL
jgi:DNA repair protein RecO (recombination protein O)